MGQPDLFPGAGARGYLLDGLSSVPATQPAASDKGNKQEQQGVTVATGLRHRRQELHLP